MLSYIVLVFSSAFIIFFVELFVLSNFTEEGTRFQVGKETKVTLSNKMLLQSGTSNANLRAGRKVHLPYVLTGRSAYIHAQSVTEILKLLRFKWVAGESEDGSWSQKGNKRPGA